MVKKLLKLFMRLQKTNQKEFRIKKVIKKREINFISNGKGMIIHQ